MKFAELFLRLIPKILSAVAEAEAIKGASGSEKKEHVLNLVRQGVNIADSTGKVNIPSDLAVQLTHEIINSVDDARNLIDTSKPSVGPGTVS